MESTRRQIQITLCLALWASLLTVTGCGSSVSPETEVDQADSETAGAATEVEPEEAAEPLTGKHVVVMETTKGTVQLELDADQAPKTVANFLQYVDDEFYDHLIFHIVNKNYMIQGGSYTFDMKTKWWRDPIPNESDNGLKNLRGTIAMARSSDNPHSATSQFIINLRDNRRLDRDDPKGDGWGYCVFGKVIEGMDVVDAIGNVETARKGSYENVPVVPVFIKSMRRAS